MLILEENDLENLVKEEVPEPEGDEAKAKHKKDMVRAKRIIVDSIKDHFPSRLITNLPTDFQSIINHLRTQLKSVKMQSSESIQLLHKGILDQGET
jgi:hypothetical protein